MNLRAIANSYTRAVNPNRMGVHLQNDGYEYSSSGDQIPKYNEFSIELQIQSIKSEMLMHLDIQTQQGQYTTFLANNLISTQVRSLAKGEDLLRFRPSNEAEQQEWKVVHLLSSFDDGSMVDGSGWVRGIAWRL